MKIITLIHRDSVVSDYRQYRPLVEMLGGKVQRTVLRKNETLTLQKLSDRYAKKCDVLNFKYIDDRKTLDVLFSMRRLAKFKTVVDIDDNLWQMEVGNVAMGNAAQHANRIFSLTGSVQSADWVTVSTEPLYNALKPLNSNIAVLPNYLDLSKWKHKRKQHKAVRIGWVWSPTHIPDMEIIEKPLRKIKEKYGDKVEIVIFGTEVDIFKGLKTTNIKGVRYWDYPKTFTEAGIDISIAPLSDNDFNKCKSNIKWLESTMAGAAFIGSKIYPYEHSIKEGKTGYLAKSEAQWVKRMEFLIENPEKRAELVENAKKEVMKINEESKKKWQQFYGYLEHEIKKESK